MDDFLKSVRTPKKAIEIKQEAQKPRGAGWPFQNLSVMQYEKFLNGAGSTFEKSILSR